MLKSKKTRIETVFLVTINDEEGNIVKIQENKDWNYVRRNGTVR